MNPNFKKAETAEFNFYVDLLDVAETHYGVGFGSEANLWVEELYLEYQNLGSQPDRCGWLKERLSKEFKSVTRSPKWMVSNYVEWPFLEGRPMVFVEQIELSENQVTREALSWDCVVYVFGGRISEEHGYRIEFRETVQDR
ncbi:MAG: hypothetical protein EOP09_10735 [Proteobacteria bacterium]|nr:MAG: hypothetical protein EOP09_10735 [Pseudomonadota bacterium]